MSAPGQERHFPQSSSISQPHTVPQTSANWLVFVLRLLVVVLLWRVGGGIQWRNSPLFDPQAKPRAVDARGDLAEDEKATIALFREASPSIVHITNLAVKRSVFRADETEIPQGTGSGFIWDQQGHVVTNFHVLQNAQAARVTLADNSSWDARLVGWEPDKDIAVVKIDAPADRLRPILIGTSHDLQVGQKVFAIGNPFGLDRTLTTGVISGLDREILSLTRRPISGVIQTDAAINPGNSGGTLLDSAGRLIGINTAIYSPSGTNSGVGFAVPVDTVNRIVPQLIKTGRVEHVGLGVTIAKDELNRQLGVAGVLILDVLEGSAAEKAGLLPTRYDKNGKLRLGDVITSVNGQAINNSMDLYRIIDTFKVGDTLEVTVSRDGDEKKFPIALQVLPSAADD
jgi:S1-C subfamily serine protease